MRAFKYTITVESDTPPQILIGQNLGGVHGDIRHLEIPPKQMITVHRQNKK